MSTHLKADTACCDLGTSVGKGILTSSDGNDVGVNHVFTVSEPSESSTEPMIDATVADPVDEVIQLIYGIMCSHNQEVLRKLDDIEIISDEREDI